MAKKRPTERERRATMPSWSDALKPYAVMYAALVMQLGEDLRAMTTEQIEAVRVACSRPTEANC